MTKRRKPSSVFGTHQPPLLAAIPLGPTAPIVVFARRPRRPQPRLLPSGPLLVVLCGPGGAERTAREVLRHRWIKILPLSLHLLSLSSRDVGLPESYGSLLACAQIVLLEFSRGKGRRGKRFQTTRHGYIVNRASVRAERR